MILKAISFNATSWEFDTYEKLTRNTVWKVPDIELEFSEEDPDSVSEKRERSAKTEF